MFGCFQIKLIAMGFICVAMIGIDKATPYSVDLPYGSSLDMNSSKHLPMPVNFRTINSTINVPLENSKPSRKRLVMSRFKRNSGSNNAVSQSVSTLSSFNISNERETLASTLNEKRAAVMIIIVFVISGLVILFYRIILDSREN